MGVSLGPDDVAFRCNLVTLGDGLMQDYSAGHIETADARALIEELGERLGSADCRFYPGVSYRHLVVLTDFDNPSIETTPPHDISGQSWQEHLPRGEGDTALVDMMSKARALLANSETNRRRTAAGKQPATDIWLWGQGKAMRVPTLKDRYQLTGSVVSAVDLVRGLGVLAAMRVRLVEGATGYLGTNYAGKVEAASEALKTENLVFLHVEAPDETSHEGSLEKKLQAIEEFDTNIVDRILRLRSTIPRLRVLVAPDHATPISLKTHHAAPVPFAACGSGLRPDGADRYCERAVENAPLYTGTSLFDAFVKGAFQ
jgi:2,3-bisphosphoglycerate-independent phosphoglycerate mutase